MKKATRYLGTDGMAVKFHFVCEACDGEGELELDRRDGPSRFACPEGCGASYVPIFNTAPPKLWCVVKPVFVRQR